MDTTRNAITDGLRNWQLRSYTGIVEHMKREGYKSSDVVDALNEMIDKGEIICTNSGCYLP